MTGQGTGRLDGRVAVITGGGSGIGRATALMFAAEGASVVAADVNLEGAKETAARGGDRVTAHKLDVTDDANWATLMAEVLERTGRFDVLVNSAGVGWPGKFEDMPLDAWNWMISVNLTGVMLGCQHAIRTMRKAGNGGSIINISSLGGLLGGEDIVGYCATKGGVTLLTKSVALYAAREKPTIRCNSVHPTYVDTEMLDPIADAVGGREAMLAHMASLVPIGRVAKPEDIAHMNLFLASDESAMVSGAQMVVDGAQMAGMPAAHSKG